jgi:hypothetical protein
VERGDLCREAARESRVSVRCARGPAGASAGRGDGAGAGGREGG